MKKYHNFLNILPPHHNFKKAKAVILPFPYEASTCWQKGTKNGPKAIIDSSYAVEFFDEELKVEAYKKTGIYTLPEIKPAKNKEKFYLPLTAKVKEIISQNKFPIILGGEHSISLGGILGVIKKYKSFSVLHFDAHSDLRDSQEGNKFSHGAVMRRIFEQKEVKNLVQVGIRNISNESEEGREFDFYQKNKNRVKIFWAKDMDKWKINGIIKSLNDNVYLTLDVDVFDPAIMPSTGTPEPGGMEWYQVVSILKEIFRKKNVIACDIVELMPLKNFEAPNFMVAKLIYKIIGYKFLVYEQKIRRRTRI